METLDVLVVDDEPGIRSGISRILQNYTVNYPFMDDDIQFKIIEASTGEEALTIINSTPPAVVLLDNKLPGIQGVEILEYINNNHLDILVIMITSSASLDLAVKATNIGAFDFVPKPFTPQELKTTMDSVAKHYFLRRMTSKMYKEGKHVRFQFLSVLSHELKSPLSIIESNLKIMLKHKAGENINFYDSMIAESISQVKSIQNMIMDLLDLTRIESGKSLRDVQQVDLCSVAKLALDTVKPLAIQRNVNIEYDTMQPIPFLADQEEMVLIFNNLVTTAIRNSKEGGIVKFSIETKDANIQIKVFVIQEGFSNGNIFGKLSEVSQSLIQSSPIHTESRLEINFIKRILDLYSGKIEVISKQDEGILFTVLLPFSQKSTT